MRAPEAARAAAARMLTPDHDRYEGVRPINIWLLRLNYLLMAAFVAPWAWTTLVSHEGPWTSMRVLALCVWATYPTLAILGLMHPLRLLPLTFFTIGYKTLWLAFMAYPMWRAGTLAGTPEEQMAKDFLWLPLLMIAVPWGYAFRTFVLPPAHWRRRSGVPANAGQVS